MLVLPIAAQTFAGRTFFMGAAAAIPVLMIKWMFYFHILTSYSLICSRP